MVAAVCGFAEFETWRLWAEHRPEDAVHEAEEVEAGNQFHAALSTSVSDEGHEGHQEADKEDGGGSQPKNESKLHGADRGVVWFLSKSEAFDLVGYDVLIGM